jgi:hypothetical protein
MGSVFNVTEALCDKLPFVASTVIGKTPTAADGDTENVTDWLVPGAREKEGGVTSTPCGRPWSVKSTELLKPCSGAMEIVIAEVELPRTAEAETGDTNTSKSTTGGGGRLSGPLAQSVRAHSAESVKANRMNFNI